jgi:phage shock protein C
MASGSSRLYRSRTDRMISGVSGGLGERLGVDSTIVRLVWALAAFFTGGAFALVYLLFWLIMPLEPAGEGL